MIAGAIFSGLAIKQQVSIILSAPSVALRLAGLTALAERLTPADDAWTCVLLLEAAGDVTKQPVTGIDTETDVNVDIPEQTNGPAGGTPGDIALALASSVGIGPTAAALKECLSQDDDIAFADGSHYLLDSVAVLVRKGLLRIFDPETVTLRDYIFAMGYGGLYLESVDMTAEGLFEIWTSPLRDSLTKTKIASHPAADVEFWYDILKRDGFSMTLQGSSTERYFMSEAVNIAFTSTLARQDPYLRQVIIASACKRPDLIALHEDRPSGDALAMALEIAFLNANGSTEPPEVLVAEAARDSRLTSEVLDWLSRSDSTTVRQWAILKVAPLLDEALPAPNPTHGARR